MMETDTTLKVVLIPLRDFKVKNEAWNAFCFQKATQFLRLLN